jgi:hypothetical protein
VYKRIILDLSQKCVVGLLFLNVNNDNNIPFVHSRSDSKFIYFYTFFIQVISPSTDKIAPVLARAMERETHLRRIFS